MSDPWPEKWWLLEVGDDPEDETVRGPFHSWYEAIRILVSTDHYHLSNPNGPIHRSDGVFGFHGNISSLYFVRSKSRPTYSEIISRKKN